MNRSAVVYAIGSKLIVASSSKTTMGVGLHVDPVVLSLDSSMGDVEVQLAESLRASDRILAHPAQSEWKGSFDPFLKAAGVRSFRSFMQNARMLMVDQDENGVTITPTRNLGAKGGFEELLNEQVALPNNVLAVAEAVLRVLKQ